MKENLKEINRQLEFLREIIEKRNQFNLNKSPRYENDGYPPDTNTQHYHVTYPNECWGCGLRKVEEIVLIVEIIKKRKKKCL